MKTAFRGASSVALILGLSSGLPAAFAQQTSGPAPQTVATTQDVDTVTQPPAEADSTRDRVVVTGSLTGNREAGELAVEVYTIDDMRKAGNPNVMEFVQSLSVVGDSVGNFDPTLAMNGGVYTDLYGPGFMNVNLRGLSDADSERTLNLLNGRRTDPNANMIPMQALQQIEILKDGASATYGAGAIGGVVNYITRKDFDGLIIEGEYKHIEAAPDAGQFEIKYTQGWSGENSNLLLTAAYSEQGGILGSAFDWALQPYNVNPRQWSTVSASTTPSVWYANTTLAGAVPDFTTASCEAVGGVNPRTGASGHPQEPGNLDHGSVCFLDNAPFLNVVQELKTYRAFAQYDSAIDNTMNFHAELSFTKTDAPNIRNPGSGTPAQSQAALESGGTGFPGGASAVGQCAALVGRCGYAVPTNHPAFADFIARANVGRTTPINPATTPSPYWAGFWRPFAYGGLYEGQPFSKGTRREDNWRGALQVHGEFSDKGLFGLGRFVPEGTTYDFSISGATRQGRVTNPDIVSWRLQEALNGFGGPNCQAQDLTPTTSTVLPQRSSFPPDAAGTTAFNAAVAAAIAAFNASIGTQNAAEAGKNGCLWFNPFASAWPANAATGAANPSYNPALANSPELVDWLYTEGATQSRYQELNIDILFAGDVPGIELPGGKMNWGLGSQWRQWEYENRALDPHMQPRFYDCPWDPWTPAGQLRQTIGGIGCDRSVASGNGPGALMSRSPRNPTMTERQILAGFAELHAPILDNLSWSGVARYEEISGSIGGWVFNTSFKWDIFDWMAFRGSWSDNFAPPNPDTLDNDGQVTTGQVGGTTGPIVPVTTIVDPELDVERTDQFSVGFLFNKNDLFFEDSTFRASIDYFNYFIDGEISTLSGNTIINRAFPALPTGTPAGTPRTTPDCSSSLFNWITLNQPCVDNVTDVSAIEAVNSLVLNGPGIKQAGIDFSADYTLPFWDGRLGLGVRGTRLLEYESREAFYQGIQIPLSLQAGFGNGEDYLGWSNVAQFFGTGKQGSLWRASVYANYGTEDMNFRWTTRLVSAVDDERGCFTYAGNGSTTGGGATCFGVDGEDHYVSDFNWTWETPWVEGMELRFSVLNVFDKDPPPLSGGEGVSGVYFPSLPYNPYIASPLGRQFEIGFAQTF